MAEVIRADPDVAGVASVVGAGIVNAAQNTGRISAVLRPRDERAADVRAIIARLQPQLDALAGVVVHLQPVQDIQIGARPGSTQYQYTLMDPDAAELGRWAPLLVATLGAAADAARRRLRPARRRAPRHGRRGPRPAPGGSA